MEQNFANRGIVAVKNTAKRSYKKTVWIILAATLIVASLAAAGYYYKQYTDIKNAPQAAQDANQQTIDAVSKLIVVPNEQPTIATVTDPNKLKDQKFFANTQIGDKVLIFTDAQKAILYRPSENKIVEVAPLNIGDDPNVAGTPQPTPPPVKK